MNWHESLLMDPVSGTGIGEQERCPYWPNRCKFGITCRNFHPVVRNCVHWPVNNLTGETCKYGDRCLYLHSGFAECKTSEHQNKKRFDTYMANKDFELSNKSIMGMASDADVFPFSTFRLGSTPPLEHMSADSMANIRMGTGEFGFSKVLRERELVEARRERSRGRGITNGLKARSEAVRHEPRQLHSTNNSHRNHNDSHHFNTMGYKPSPYDHNPSSNSSNSSHSSNSSGNSSGNRNGAAPGSNSNVVSQAAVELARIQLELERVRLAAAEQRTIALKAEAEAKAAKEFAATILAEKQLKDDQEHVLWRRTDHPIALSGAIGLHAEKINLKFFLLSRGDEHGGGSLYGDHPELLGSETIIEYLPSVKQWQVKAKEDLGKNICFAFLACQRPYPLLNFSATSGLRDDAWQGHDGIRWCAMPTLSLARIAE